MADEMLKPCVFCQGAGFFNEEPCKRCQGSGKEPEFINEFVVTLRACEVRPDEWAALISTNRPMDQAHLVHHIGLFLEQAQKHYHNIVVHPKPPSKTM